MPRRLLCPGKNGRLPFFHKYINLNKFFINPNGFSVDVRRPEKEWQIIGTPRHGVYVFSIQPQGIPTQTFFSFFRTTKESQGGNQLYRAALKQMLILTFLFH